MSDLITYPTSLRELVRGFYAEHPYVSLDTAAHELGLAVKQVRSARAALTRNAMVPNLRTSRKRNPKSITARVEAYFRANPWANYQQAGEALGLTEKQARNSRFRREVVRA